MTVTLIVAIQTWIGLSTDTKPSAPPVGSTFYETDSGATHVYDGSAWQQKLSIGGYRAIKTLVFTGAAGLGAVGAVPLFTVTGEVLISVIVPFCTVNLGEAAPGATLALGVVGATTLLIAATIVLDIDANEFWVDTTPDANGVAVPAALKDIVITDNIIGTAAVADVNAGAIRFTVYWVPVSADGNVVAA